MEANPTAALALVVLAIAWVVGWWILESGAPPCICGHTKGEHVQLVPSSSGRIAQSSGRGYCKLCRCRLYIEK